MRHYRRRFHPWEKRHFQHLLAESRTAPPRLVCRLGSHELWARGEGMYLIDAIPDDAPPLVREGIARRRIVDLEGACPCGASLVVEPGGNGVLHLSCTHESDCPAGNDILIPAYMNWQRR